MKKGALIGLSMLFLVVGMWWSVVTGQPEVMCLWVSLAFIGFCALSVRYGL